MNVLCFKVNQLGDNVVYLPVAQWLGRVLPPGSVTIFTSPLAAPLYERCAPGVKVAVAPTDQFKSAWKHPRRLWGLYRQVSATRPDACLITHDQGNVAYLLARMCRARFCVGAQVPHLKINSWLSHRFPVAWDTPVPLQNWALLREFLQTVGVGLEDFPESPPPPDLSGMLEGVTRGAGGEVVIHPGASREYQRWPIERYVELANRLSLRRPVCWIQQKMPEEAALRPEIEQYVPDSLPAFVRKLGGAAFFIGNNSGPMHLASALGVSGLVLIGPSTYNWDPFWHASQFTILREPRLACQPCDHVTKPVDRCQNVETPMACLRRWTVDEVHDAVWQRLQAS